MRHRKYSDLRKANHRSGMGSRSNNNSVTATSASRHRCPIGQCASKQQWYTALL